MPPSDSLQHQDLKLAEALSEIQAIEMPPPTYSAMPEDNETFHAYEVDDYNDDGCAAPSPIVIKINASIYINGQSNTVVMPPTNVSAGSSSTLATRAAQASNGRAERLTRTVLAALKDAALLEDAERRQRPLELHVDASVRVAGEKNMICAGISRTAQDSAQSTQRRRPSGPESSSNDGKKRKAEAVCYARSRGFW